MNLAKSNIVIAYVATPHRGYLNFFREHAGGVLYILGKEFISSFPSLVKNLPGNEPEEVALMVRALHIFADVRILTHEGLAEVRQLPTVVMPDEDVSKSFASTFLPEVAVVFDGTWRLRWDWGQVNAHRRPEGEEIVTVEEFHRAMMGRAFASAKQSPDWWRQVGSALAREGELLFTAWNDHVPSPQSAYCYGDPRSVFDPPGTHIEMSGAVHSEAAITAAAAEAGIPMRGCDLYVTTFPCPPCAYLVARTGISRLFYTQGYSLIEGATELRSRGVSIIRVDMGQ